MEIVRYSLYGFSPQYQKHHLKYVNFHLHNFSITSFPKHLQPFIAETHKQLVPFFKENLFDLQYGVWAFIKGHKNQQSLNHLKMLVPCWEAEISDLTEVFDVNWTKKMSITDPSCEHFGFYLPERELTKITFVKRKFSKNKRMDVKQS